MGVVHSGMEIMSMPKKMLASGARAGPNDTTSGLTLEYLRKLGKTEGSE